MLRLSKQRERKESRMKNWTIEDVKNLDVWLKQNHNCRVIYPVLERMNGFDINIAHPEEVDPEQLVKQFDEEFVNGGKN